MASLAFLLQTQLKYEEAETLLKQALAGTCNLLGSNHPDTLRAIQNLALLLVSKENYQEAEVLFNEALTSHPHILATLNNFAAMLKERKIPKLRVSLRRHWKEGASFSGRTTPKPSVPSINWPWLWKSREKMLRLKCFTRRHWKKSGVCLGMTILQPSAK